MAPELEQLSWATLRSALAEAQHQCPSARRRGSWQYQPEEMDGRDGGQGEKTGVGWEEHGAANSQGQQHNCQGPPHELRNQFNVEEANNEGAKDDNKDGGQRRGLVDG